MNKQQILDDDGGLDDPLIRKMRIVYSPHILAALMSIPGAHNDDREVAHAVSLSDKLARAIVMQPVES